jgi:high affinity sulfate transporter 1
VAHSLAAIATGIPGLRTARAYQRAWLPKDVVAGLVLGSLLVPQGMAYAELAGLPAITGLYTSILCLIAYAIFGPSKILVLGPDSALGGMIAATVLPLAAANGDPDAAIAYASILAIMVGALMLIGARTGLGFIAELLSTPIQMGYMNGLALTILVGQLPKLFGFSTDADGFIGEAQAFAQGVRGGEVVPAAAAIGLFSVALMLVLGRIAPKIPAVLVAVVTAMVIAFALDLQAKGVSLVGVLPEGLPRFSIPIVPLEDVALLFAGAIGIAVVSLADTISVSSAFAARTGQEVDADNEMIGIGAANVAVGLFSGFPISTSSSRTAVAERAGAKSQLTGLIGAALIAVMLVFLPGLLAYLPNPTLAAVVIVASISLADIPGTVRLYRQRPTEFALAMAAFLGVALLGVLPGIAVAVTLSILTVFRRVWNPYRTTLGDVPDVPGFHDVRMYPEAEQLPGLVIFRFDGPLFFANATTFRQEIRKLARREPPPAWIVVSAEPITDIDTTASDMLEELDGELEAKGIELVFAELKDVVRNKIRHYDEQWFTDRAIFYPTTRSAVKAYRAAFGLVEPHDGAETVALEPGTGAATAALEAPASGEPAGAETAIADGTGAAEMPASPRHSSDPDEGGAGRQD